MDVSDIIWRLLFTLVFSKTSLQLFPFSFQRETGIATTIWRNKERGELQVLCLLSLSLLYCGHSFEYWSYFLFTRLLRGHIVADTLLPMMFLGLRKLGNICCEHKTFLNIFCVLDTKFVSATNVARVGKRGKTGKKTGKHLCPQQCVLVCQGHETFIPNKQRSRCWC